MSRNPLNQPKYDYRAFEEWNRGVRRSINEYDSTNKYYPACLLGQVVSQPKATYSATGERICAVDGCYALLRHLRSRLCEPHREARYRAGKHTRRT